MKKNYVLGFLFNTERTLVALIDKRRPAWQRGCLNGIGGKIEPGEYPAVAMQREFFEETGVRIPAHDWRLFCRMSGSDFEVYCYKMFGSCIGFVKTTTDEEIIPVRISNLDNLRLIPNLRWLIPLALDAENTTAEVQTYLPGEGPKNG